MLNSPDIGDRCSRWDRVHKLDVSIERREAQRALVTRSKGGWYRARGEERGVGDQTGLDVPCCAENVSHTLPTGTLPTGASYKYIQRRRTIAICSRRGHLLAGFARPDLPTEPRARVSFDGRWASLYGRNGSPAPIILRRQSRCAAWRAGKILRQQMVSDKPHVKLQSVAGAVLFPSVSIFFLTMRRRQVWTAVGSKNCAVCRWSSRSRNLARLEIFVNCR